MKTRLLPILILLFFFTITNLKAQETEATGNEYNGTSKPELSGFVKTTAYYDVERIAGKPFLSAFTTAAGLSIGKSKPGSYRYFSDIRFRYGAEFNEPVNQIIIREAFVELFLTDFLKLSAGQKIIKYGRADFTNTNSRINPQNYVSRSPDREDADLGNIIASAEWSPGRTFNMEAVLIPFYRPSNLLTGPVPVPQGVVIDQLKSLVTDEKLTGYGIRAGFHPRGIDFGITWFDGYDPMPGIKLNSVSVEMEGMVPDVNVRLKTAPYKIRSASIDFETSAGAIGLRGEAAWAEPYPHSGTSEYVPLGEIKWVAGADYNPGNWKFIAEYSGKLIPGFTPSPGASLIGSEIDYLQIAGLMQEPGFDLTEYLRQQTAAFNRLYNYQAEKHYHSCGLRIERELAWGKINTSIFTICNLTTRDLLFIPEFRYKPNDTVTFIAGAEIYSGRQGSLYRLVNDFMESVYLSIRMNF